MKLDIALVVRRPSPEELWAKVANHIPRDILLGWVKEIHGPDIADYFWNEEIEQDTGFPYLHYMDGTRVCRLDMSEPPCWIWQRSYHYYLNS